jgi:SAM-dependent methyltransferase
MKDSIFNKKYAEFYDLFNQGKDYTEECNFLEQAFSNYGKIPVNKILDLGCGTGFHDIELTKRRYNLTGVDISPEMIEIGKRRNKDIEFIVGNMSNFNLNKKFDSIICMFSAIGYLTENKQIEDFFRTARRHLDNKGLLVIDCWNGLGVMNELPSSREKTVQVGDLKIVRKSFPYLNAKNHINNVKFNVNIFKQDSLIENYEENHKVRFFFPKELEKYMNDEGFELLNLCPSFKLERQVSEKDWNMTLIAQLNKN